MYISKRSGMDHTVLPANTPCVPFLCKRSPDGATSNWGKRHPIAACYSSIDPEGIKGWVGLVGWPIADDLPTQVVTRQLQVERRTGKVRRPKTDVLPLWHATSQVQAWGFIKKRVLELQNPRTDCRKILRGWLHRRCHPARQNSKRSRRGGVVENRWHIVPSAHVKWNEINAAINVSCSIHCTCVDDAMR